MQRLKRLGYAGEIMVVSAEPVAGYNRVLLPEYVAGEMSADELASDCDWLDMLTVTVLYNAEVTSIDLPGRIAEVDAADGLSLVRFDQVVLATGSEPFIPPCLDSSLSGLVPLRTLGDANTILSRVRRDMPVTVFGGGLLGLEAADALARLGCRVTVVHRASCLLNRQLDATAAELLKTKLNERGITILLDAQTVEHRQEGSSQELLLKNGLCIKSQLIVVACGTTARDNLADRAGLVCRDGVVVDESLRAKTNVFAIGECANVVGRRYALVDAVNAQADVLAESLMGTHQTLRSLSLGTHLKVSGVDLFAAGDAGEASDKTDAVVFDDLNGIYRRLVFVGRRLVGAVFFGDTSLSRKVISLLGQELSFSDRDDLLFAVRG